MKKGIGCLIGIIVALVLILLSIFLPWYSTNVTGGGAEMSANIYLDKTEMDSFLGKTTLSNEGVDYIQNTMYLTIITLIICIIALIGILGFVFNFGNHETMKKIGTGLGIVTFIFALITIFYFMIASTNIISESASIYFEITGQDVPDIGFWYSDTINGASISSGPSFSWYFMLIGGIMALGSAIMLLLKKEKVKVPVS
jgi:hypothetical protein